MGGCLFVLGEKFLIAMHIHDTYSKLRSQRAWRSARIAQCRQRTRMGMHGQAGGRIGAHGKESAAAVPRQARVVGEAVTWMHTTAVLYHLLQEIRGSCCARDVVPCVRKSHHPPSSSKDPRDP